MNEGLEIGDVVTFCNTKHDYRHNALILGFGENEFAVLVHVVDDGYQPMPQVELNVPWATADEDGRYYVVEVRCS